MTSPYFHVSLFYLHLDHNHPTQAYSQETPPSSHLTQEQSRSGMQSGFISWAHRVGFNVQLMWCVEKGLEWHGSPLGEDIMASGGVCCVSAGCGEWGPPYNVLRLIVGEHVLRRRRSLLFETTVSSASDSLLAGREANDDNKVSHFCWNEFAGTSLFPSSRSFSPNNLGSPHSENTAVVIYMRRLRSLCLRG